MLIRDAALAPTAQGCAIAVMAKASIPGRTKTRLVPPLTYEEAALLNTAFLKDVITNLALAGKKATIASFAAFGPPGVAPLFETMLAADVGLIEAWLPDFGDCLFEAAKILLDMGYGAACLLNSDSPTLPTAWLTEAASILTRPGDRVVLGPSDDGGYYIIGIKALHRRLFDDVAWSTEVVARQTLDRASELGLETIILPTWYDVDDAASLRQLIRETSRGVVSPVGTVRYAAFHSAAALRDMLAAGDFAARLGLAAEIDYRRRVAGA
jgi:rSAM/selenodomain-associated transferase 1